MLCCCYMTIVSVTLELFQVLEDSEEHLQRGSFTSFNETPLNSICKNENKTNLERQ